LVSATGDSMTMPPLSGGGDSSPTVAMSAYLLGGRFQLGPQLGGHRTGEVYSAVDTVTGVSCAVKIVGPKVFATPLVAQRTERELRQLQKVTSDRIARIVDVGRQNERVWVASELVNGTPLAEIVNANGPLPPKQAMRLAIEVGEALAEAAKLG